MAEAGSRATMMQFVKFAVVGASGVLVNLAVFNLVVFAWGEKHALLPDLLANALGFVVSVFSNYCLNRRWTFRSHGEVGGELTKFFAVSLFAYVLNLGVFSLCRAGLGLDADVSQITAIAVVMPVNYMLNRFWSFRPAVLTRAGT